MIDKSKIKELTEKYGGVVPRYTSYPTAPEWKGEYSEEVFFKAIERSNAQGDDYSLYLHIPFCESQCYYCGCNVIISKEHGIERKYIDRLKEEIKLIGSKVSKDRKAAQIAWGGGTPTYLSPEQIREVYSCIEENFTLYPKDHKGHEYSIEIDPRVTDEEQLRTLFELGFNRLSMGIQDFNPETQENINRIQPFEMVKDIVEKSRAVGFKSINFDLIYGLPFQTLESFKDTVEKTKAIDPERIALFNYAHIPSMFPFQKKYIKDETLPGQEEKLEIFDLAHKEFTEFGYEFIGMDHFAKPEDELAISQKSKTLYRNFQGFTTHYGCDLYGMGVSAISDVSGVYKQNYKKILNYQNELNEMDEFGADKFLLCDEEDLRRRKIIKDLMCNYQTEFALDTHLYELKELQEFVDDELVEMQVDEGLVKLEITELGKFFVRNIASKFDTYIGKETGHKVFSKAL